MALSFKGTALFILATGLFLTTVPSFSDARDYTRCGVAVRCAIIGYHLTTRCPQAV